MHYFHFLFTTIRKKEPNNSSIIYHGYERLRIEFLNTYYMQ